MRSPAFVLLVLLGASVSQYSCLTLFVLTSFRSLGCTRRSPGVAPLYQASLEAVAILRLIVTDATGETPQVSFLF